MKFLIASDIHGSAYYCDLLIKAIETEKADRVLILGDILYHGPRNDLPKDYAPKKVIEMLNPLKDKLLCVRGNCDTEVDQMVLEFPIMADYSVIPWGTGLYMPPTVTFLTKIIFRLCHKVIFCLTGIPIFQNVWSIVILFI